MYCNKCKKESPGEVCETCGANLTQEKPKKEFSLFWCIASCVVIGSMIAFLATQIIMSILISTSIPNLITGVIAIVFNLLVFSFISYDVIKTYIENKKENPSEKVVNKAKIYYKVTKILLFLVLVGAIAMGICLGIFGLMGSMNY